MTFVSSNYSYLNILSLSQFLGKEYQATYLGHRIIDLLPSLSPETIAVVSVEVRRHALRPTIPRLSSLHSIMRNEQD